MPIRSREDIIAILNEALETFDPYGDGFKFEMRDAVDEALCFITGNNAPINSLGDELLAAHRRQEAIRAENAKTRHE